MRLELVKKSIETGELQLEGWQKYTHFEPAFALFFVSVIIFAVYFHGYLTGTNKIDFTEAFLFAIFWTILGTIVFFVQKRRLKFGWIITNLSREQIDKIIDEVGNELGWQKCQETKKLFIAKTYPKFWSGSWGEQITVIFDGDKILINSICDPDNRASVVSMGRNEQNVQTLIEKIKKRTIENLANKK